MSTRRKILRVSPELLVEMSIAGRESHVICREGLPEGSEAITAFMTSDTGFIQILVEHESFPEVPEGAAYPVLSPPVFERLEIDAR